MPAHSPPALFVIQPSSAASRSLHALSRSSLTHAAGPGKPPVPVTSARRIPAATPESSGEGALRLTRIGYCCILAREMGKDGARSRLEGMERLAGAPHLLQRPCRVWHGDWAATRTMPPFHRGTKQLALLSRSLRCRVACRFGERRYGHDHKIMYAPVQSGTLLCGMI
jgi:hypothetical protein